MGLLAFVIRSVTVGSALDTAGAIAAIVGASVALVLFLGGLVRWWHRNHHPMRGVKARIERREHEVLMLVVSGLPPSLHTIAVLVTDDQDQGQRHGPTQLNSGLPELEFNLTRGQPALNPCAATYFVDVTVTFVGGVQRRVLRKRAALPGQRETARHDQEGGGG